MRQLPEDQRLLQIYLKGRLVWSGWMHSIGKMKLNYENTSDNPDLYAVYLPYLKTVGLKHAKNSMF